jgi:hypothetical protein
MKNKNGALKEPMDVGTEEFKKFQEIIKMKVETKKIETALLEAIYISRWTENQEALISLLTPEEAMKIVANIFEELDNIGYEIRKK